MKAFDIVVAADERGGIGKDGQLPWSLRGDVDHFRALTLGTRSWGERDLGEPQARNAVIMGRRTWHSIPRQFRPLVGRLNVVVTRSRALGLPAGVLRASRLEHGLSLLAQARACGAVADVFVIGGGELFQRALALPQCRRVHLSRVSGHFDCDTWLPDLGSAFALTSRSAPRRDGGLRYVVEVYERVHGDSLKVAQRSAIVVP